MCGLMKWSTSMSIDDDVHNDHADSFFLFVLFLSLRRFNLVFVLFWMFGPIFVSFFFFLTNESTYSTNSLKLSHHFVLMSNNSQQYIFRIKTIHLAINNNLNMIHTKSKLCERLRFQLMLLASLNTKY